MDPNIAGKEHVEVAGQGSVKAIVEQGWTVSPSATVIGRRTLSLRYSSLWLARKATNQPGTTTTLHWLCQRISQFDHFHQNYKLIIVKSQ